MKVAFPLAAHKHIIKYKNIHVFLHLCILMPMLKIYSTISSICIYTPLHRGHIQAGVPTVRLKYNYAHITISS